MISTIPEKDSVLSDGDTVVLVVSLGKETQQVDMPGLLGQTEDMARKMLTSKGLDVGSVEHEYSNDYPKGQVCFQSVNEGTKVDQHSHQHHHQRRSRPQHPADSHRGHQDSQLHPAGRRCCGQRGCLRFPGQ